MAETNEKWVPKGESLTLDNLAPDEHPLFRFVLRSLPQNLLQALQNPTEAAEYLNAALWEDSDEMALVALRDIAEARQIQAEPGRQVAREPDRMFAELKYRDSETYRRGFPARCYAKVQP